MILFDGSIDCILESIYTGIPMTDRISHATVLINPKVVTYLSKKICILTKDSDKIETLVKNDNTVVSRVTQSYMKGVHLDPYLPKILPRIQWNGDTVRYITLETYDHCIEYTYNTVTGVLSYPKPVEYLGEHQENGEVNSMGYILYQLGEDIFPQDNPYKDLDLVKLGKGYF